MQPTCELCGRAARLTFHHLIPRALHANKWFKARFTREAMKAGLSLCRQCHSAIHQFITEKEMGRAFNTRDKLLAHPQVARFIVWVRKQRVRHDGRRM